MPRPPWYLPVGEPLDPARRDLLLATFRDEAVRVGRVLRAKAGREWKPARVETRLYRPGDLPNWPGGFTRDPDTDAAGIAQLAHGGSFAWTVVTIAVGWETGAVFAVPPGGVRWRPAGGG